MRRYTATLFLAVIGEAIRSLDRPFRRLSSGDLGLYGADRGLDSEAFLWLDPAVKPEEVSALLQREGFAVEVVPAVPGKSRTRLSIRRGTAVFVCPRCKGERYERGKTSRKKLCSFCDGVVVPQGVPQGVSYALRLYVTSIRAVIATDPTIGEVTFGLRGDKGLDTQAELVVARARAAGLAAALRTAGYGVERLLGDDDPTILSVTRGAVVFPCPRCKGASSERRPTNGEPPCGFCLRRDLTPEEPPPC